MSDIVEKGNPYFSPICNNCIHQDRDTLVTCSAFIFGIPNVILSGKVGHTKPLPKQGNKIIFEAKEDDTGD